MRNWKLAFSVFLCYNVPMSVGLNTNIRRFFWDVDPDSLDLKKHKEYIIARILEYGDMDAITWMFAKFGKSSIREVLKTHRGFSPRTLYFWKSFFNLRENQILCLKKSYLKTHEKLWLY